MIRMREDWIEIFEKIVGRKPSLLEIEVGKEINFDLKKIPEIAGLAPNISNQQVSPVVVQPRLPIWNRVIRRYQNLSVKKRLALSSFLLLVVVGTSLGIIVMNHNSNKLVEELEQVITAHQYDKLANLLSTEEDKWTKEEAQSYLDYLEEEEIDFVEGIEGLLQIEAEEKVYFDDKVNRLFGLEESGRTLGLFPEYRLAIYPVEVSVKTNLSDLKLDGQVIAKDQVVSLGTKKWGAKHHEFEGKIDSYILQTRIALPFEEVRDNQLQWNIETEEVEVTAKLDSYVSSFEQTKLVINERQRSDGLRKKVKVVGGQEMGVYALVKYAGSDYVTKQKNLYIKPRQSVLEVQLVFSEEVEQKLGEQARQKEEKKKAAEAEAAKKAEETRQQAERKEAEEKEREEYATRARPNLDLFLKEYRDAVFRSVSQRNDQYAKYYDVSSAVYQEMVNWTMGGGVNRAKIDYYTAGRLTIEDIEYQDGIFRVRTYEDFSVHYLDSRPTTVNQRTKVYSIKFENDEFRIFDIAVSE